MPGGIQSAPQQSGLPYLKQCHHLIESSALPSEKTSRLACEVARHLGAAQALPQWSQQALQQHAGDPREVKSLSQLEDGQTGDSIWDAMQHQLKTHGAALSCPQPSAHLPIMHSGYEHCHQMCLPGCRYERADVALVPECVLTDWACLCAGELHNNLRMKW